MSNNNFYNNFRGSTFQNSLMSPLSVPPPPHPPPELFVPINSQSHAPNFDVLDQEYIKMFENVALKAPALKKNTKVSISQVRDKLRNLALSLNELKRQEKELIDKENTCSEEEWKDAVQKADRNKMLITDLLSDVNSNYLDMLKKLIAKRMAKRQRLKRLRIEKKRAKEDRIKDMKEKSRKIDESLQKIKDAINKVKQEEESKLQADMILKEVLRKKHNAKKFLSKLDALKKLRVARLNTVKGRGENTSLYESEEIDGKIDKLKLLWAQKLLIYEKEEEDLRSKLKHDSDTNKVEDSLMEKQSASNLKKWRKVLFGEATTAPQMDFNGDIARFVAVRCQWDQYTNESGSTIPIGWVTPSMPPE